MNVKELVDLIEEHTIYCVFEYEDLKFREQCTQSLTHFGMWLKIVKQTMDKQDNVFKGGRAVSLPVAVHIDLKPDKEQL